MLGRAVLGFGCAVLLTGCAAGQITQTDTMEVALNGTSADQDTIAIRNAEVSFPADQGSPVFQPGSDIDARMSIINEAAQPDRLLSAQSDAASEVTIEGQQEILADEVLMLDFQDVPDDVAQGELTLEGLTRTLRPGEEVDLTLTFQNAGEITFTVPMVTPDEPREETAEP